MMSSAQDRLSQLCATLRALSRGADEELSIALGGVADGMSRIAVELDETRALLRADVSAPKIARRSRLIVKRIAAKAVRRG